ncbi:MAG: DUF2157 domain-containing protein [Spirulina sp. SIO3F2]|nr:DUF2157 domain-containing protein [Spirulina sp. SIO3F2]
MVSEKFRHQLRQEAANWRDEALISPEVFSQLSDRYQFDQLDRSARNRFVMILLGLGAILLGLAAITFVAANWQAWSRLARVVLMMSLFIGVNSGGFFLWRNTQRGWSRLGQALLLLGGLLIGANLALFSQMFHQTGSIHELYLIWGLAVLAMAYSLRLTSLGVLSMLLTMQGDFVVLPSDPQSLWTLFLQYFPLVSILLFLPLAYWCKSRWLAGLTLVFVSIILQLHLVRALEAASWDEMWIAPYLMVAATCLIPLLLWAYRDRHWPHLAPNLAVFYVSLWSTIFAFHYWWQDSPTIGTAGLSRELIPPLINFGCFSLLTVVLWWRLGFIQGSIWRLELISTTFALLLLSLGGLVLWHSWSGPLIVFGPLWCNVVLILLAIACIREALGKGQRLGFWWGILLLVEQILSRMLEYDTGLLAKALVLFLCGIGVIVAGLWFERYVRRLEPTAIASGQIKPAA